MTDGPTTGSGDGDHQAEKAELITRLISLRREAEIASGSVLPLSILPSTDGGWGEWCQAIGREMDDARAIIQNAGLPASTDDIWRHPFNMDPPAGFRFGFVASMRATVAAIGDPDDRKKPDWRLKELVKDRAIWIRDAKPATNIDARVRRVEVFFPTSISTAKIEEFKQVAIEYDRRKKTS